MQKSRAWIEINLENLEYNIRQIKNNISEGTEIMAVIKANAYGHGDVLIAKKLNEIGITNFAVATLEEGIHLRENKIKGNILILGYTHPHYVDKIIENDLIQTLVDEQYSKQIEKFNNTNKQLKVHIKINTGMNRIGFSPKNINEIENIFNNSKIKVTGVFSHLAVSDEENEESINFTKKQMQEFENCVKLLKAKNYEVGKVHIQNSYGMFYKTDFKYDYIRTGIFIYGITDKNEVHLKPVLSLKARVESVHSIEKDETVGYGRNYIAKGQEKIAAISIGYADGYPRELSNKGANVIINGQYAEIIGKICMDQLMVNVTHIEDISSGDIVTLIGKDNNNEIYVNEIASKASTIPYEIISRLGTRLPRISEQEM